MISPMRYPTFEAGTAPRAQALTCRVEDRPQEFLAWNSQITRIENFRVDSSGEIDWSVALHAENVLGLEKIDPKEDSCSVELRQNDAGMRYSASCTLSLALHGFTGLTVELTHDAASGEGYYVLTRSYAGGSGGLVIPFNDCR
jgi:hypothetical protein